MSSTGVHTQVCDGINIIGNEEVITHLEKAHEALPHFFSKLIPRHHP